MRPLSAIACVLLSAGLLAALPATAAAQGAAAECVQKRNGESSMHRHCWDGGKRQGRWVVRLPGGEVREGSYVAGKKQGRWVIRLPDGGVQEGPYVAGEKQGRWVLRHPDGTVEEGPVVAGQREGRWVARRPDGSRRTFEMDAGALVAGSVVRVAAQARGGSGDRNAAALTREDRRRLQSALAAQGFDPGPADGVFGPRTSRAIKAWQASKGYAATGVLTGGQAVAASAPSRAQDTVLDQSLRTAAGEDANLSVLLGYLKGGANPNSTDTLGRTALHYAAAGGAARNLEALLANGGDPGVKDHDGNTPLHVAADASSPTLRDRESVAAMRVLLEGGADANLANREGDTPLHVAARTHGGFNEYAGGVELLLRAGADPNKTNARGNTPLHAAVEPYSSQRPAEAVGALLDAGADPKAVNRDRLTPLLMFTIHGADDGRPAELLLRAGADPDGKAPNGDAPLHIAIREGGNRGKEEVVDALLAGGADPCIEDAKGFIPYHVATEGGNIHRALDRADGYDRACDPREKGQGAVADARAKEADERQRAEAKRRQREAEERQQAEAKRREREAEAKHKRALAALEPKCPTRRAENWRSPGDAKCWIKLANKPGCHAWGWGSRLSDRGEVLWSGGCTGRLASGEGILSLRHKESGDTYVNGKRPGWYGASLEGAYVDGKPHGQWTENFSYNVETGTFGLVYEGSYVDGKRHGRWRRLEYDEGKLHAVLEGSYVDGKAHGQWTIRSLSGYVNGGLVWICDHAELIRGDIVDDGFVGGSGC